MFLSLLTKEELCVLTKAISRLSASERKDSLLEELLKEQGRRFKEGEEKENENENLTEKTFEDIKISYQEEIDNFKNAKIKEMKEEYQKYERVMGCKNKIIRQYLTEVNVLRQKALKIIGTIELMEDL